MSPHLLVPVVLLGLCLLMLMQAPRLHRRQERRRQRAEAEARARVRRWIHAINLDRCTGCEACVEVCPTYVLEIVDHKSQVVHRDQCIECRQCAQACPSTALVMHREGDEPPTFRAPAIDDNLETAVPGQYLIGEVAGKPLVKNAANMGRLVVEHMLRGGLTPGGGTGGERDPLDVAIVGSGPGGLSAALTCRHRGLSAVVLEKEPMIASTVARYPRGKRFLAEPYDCKNLSFLPVFDASKEDLVATWQQVAERAGLQIRTSTSVEEVKRQGDGLFAVKLASGTLFARRVVLALGTRGKPRTLGVPGESLVKVATMLDDPQSHRGQSVLVVGGGDSALEAAIALAEAGARRVTLSYRGKSFGRAKSKNKQALAERTASGQIEVLLGSQVQEITDDAVKIRLADGQVIENQAVYVLIGADAPLKWLEKCGVEVVERSHWHRFGATDEKLVALGLAGECPDDVEAAVARVLGRPARIIAAGTRPPLRSAPTTAEVVWQCAPAPARPADDWEDAEPTRLWSGMRSRVHADLTLVDTPRAVRRRARSR